MPRPFKLSFGHTSRAKIPDVANMAFEFIRFGTHVRLHHTLCTLTWQMLLCISMVIWSIVKPPKVFFIKLGDLFIDFSGK